MEKFEALARAIDAVSSGPRTLEQETDLVSLRELAGENGEQGLAEKIRRVLGEKMVIKPIPGGARMIRRIHWKEYLEKLEAGGG